MTTKALHILISSTITQLINELEGLSIEDLKRTVDSTGGDSDTRSIQTIITHLIYSDLKYIDYVNKRLNRNTINPEKQLLETPNEYVFELENLKSVFYDLFENLDDSLLEEIDEANKIRTEWGQKYDIEQLLEHSIVHKQKHIIQIAKYKSTF